MVAAARRRRSLVTPSLSRPLFALCCYCCLISCTIACSGVVGASHVDHVYVTRDESHLVTSSTLRWTPAAAIDVTGRMVRASDDVVYCRAVFRGVVWPGSANATTPNQCKLALPAGATNIDSPSASRHHGSAVLTDVASTARLIWRPWNPYTPVPITGLVAVGGRRRRDHLQHRAYVARHRPCSDCPSVAGHFSPRRGVGGLIRVYGAASPIDVTSGQLLVEVTPIRYELPANATTFHIASATETRVDVMLARVTLSLMSDVSDDRDASDSRKIVTSAVVTNVTSTFSWGGHRRRHRRRPHSDGLARGVASLAPAYGRRRRMRFKWGLASHRIHRIVRPIQATLASGTASECVVSGTRVTKTIPYEASMRIVFADGVVSDGHVIKGQFHRQSVMTRIRTACGSPFNITTGRQIAVGRVPSSRLDYDTTTAEKADWKSSVTTTMTTTTAAANVDHCATSTITTTTTTLRDTPDVRDVSDARLVALYPTQAEAARTVADQLGLAIRRMSAESRTKQDSDGNDDIFAYWLNNLQSRDLRDAVHSAANARRIVRLIRQSFASERDNNNDDKDDGRQVRRDASIWTMMTDVDPRRLSPVVVRESSISTHHTSMGRRRSAATATCVTTAAIAVVINALHTF